MNRIRSIDERLKQRRVLLQNFTFTKKIRGGALYISVMVSIVMGVILSLLLLLTNYNQRHVTSFAATTQLVYNLKSALQIAQSAYFTPSQNSTWIKNLVNDDSVRVKKMCWGAYLVICAETKNRHQYLTQSGLYGTFMSADTGLLVSDNSRAVGLSGNVILKSNCYFPKAGIRPAYIEGQSYISNAGNSQYIKSSPGNIPEINHTFYNGLENQLAGFNAYQDSAAGILPDTWDQSFLGKTLVCEVYSQEMKNKHLKNNIRLICEAIEIDSTARLDNILIVCKKVKFKSGFKGSVHIIAEDSVSMEENCYFAYPSSFVLLAGKEQIAGVRCIQFNKHCVFYGGVLALPGQAAGTGLQDVFVKLNADSELNGFIYSGNYIHLEGRVNATVIANKLLLKTPSAVYENHILGCEINPAKYANLLAIPLVFNQQAKLVCCGRMNE